MKTSSLQLFINYLNSIGIENHPSIYRWTVKTIYGNLLVDIHNSDFTKSGQPRKLSKVYSIFSRFEDFDKSNQFLKDYYNSFHFTSKWNFHYYSWDYTFERFRTCLDPILFHE
jgi:hypothetical protein